ncbi:hypothetical protein AS156_16545 [Bradyrhizobium macuxiense]|uniref:Autotransporter domain-containing protein n=1 Tax=Bradyrhizobium macuxiense TaxID=1755647 RepID=A0A109JHL1_9BRAD|nr:hypothetical protein AS156_16545 [Bradyrhizobium macuxiense]
MRAVTYRKVDVDGIGVFYREAGPKDAPTILLLRGFPTAGHMHCFAISSRYSPTSFASWLPTCRGSGNPTRPRGAPSPTRSRTSRTSSIASPRCSELGLRTDKSFQVQDGILTLRTGFAWAHDYDPDRSVAATFQALPGASFVVNGAAQASDSALTTAAVEMKWRNGWSAAATFEGEFSNVTRATQARAWCDISGEARWMT